MNETHEHIMHTQKLFLMMIKNRLPSCAIHIENVPWSDISSAVCILFRVFIFEVRLMGTLRAFSKRFQLKQGGQEMVAREAGKDYFCANEIKQC